MSNRISRNRSFGGWQDVYTHSSSTLGCEMKVAVYLPPQAAHGRRPVLTFLSGLTCTEQNVITKAGIQALASHHGLILVCPDTSPRGEGVADDPAWDLGQGAGFYVNATQAPWAAHYQMHDYVVNELPAWVQAHFPATDAQSITGHSMGGHGALVAALRHPGKYKSVSAISPVCAPIQCPWGEKAFSAYLGEDRATWQDWDTTSLIAKPREERLPLLVDVGEADNFLHEQLKPELLRAACAEAKHPLKLNLRRHYDHSYYFVSTVLPEHVAHHAAALLA